MKGSISALALVALVSLMGISGSLPFSAVSFAQPQPHGLPNNALNNVINNAINGVSTALSHVPKNTPAYSLLSQSLSYLQRAQKLASEGNMSGAQFYFNLAMEKSYKGVNEAVGNDNSGEGQPAQPGLNVSRSVQLAFANKLENELQAVNNATLKGEAQALIQSAVQLLNSPHFNASALVQARHELNNASFIINTDAEHRLFHEMGVIPFNNASFVVQSLIHGNRTFVDGYIGVYNGKVYLELYVPLNEIRLGNTTLYAEPSIEAINVTQPIKPMPQAPPINPMRGFAKHFSRIEVLGIVNSTYAVSFVGAHKGQFIIVSVRGFLPVELKDIGNYSSMPSGHLLVYYEPAFYTHKPIPMGYPVMNRNSMPLVATDNLFAHTRFS